MRLAPVLVLALLAGCAGAPASPHVPVASRFDWTLAGCREIVAQFNVDSAALAAVLPPGFRPSAGAIPGKTGVGIDAFACEGTWPSYASFWAIVDAPRDKMGDATVGFVKWDTLVPEGAALDALERANASVRAGRVAIDPLTPAGGLTGTILFDAAGVTTITIPPGANPRAGAAGSMLLREFSPAGADGKSVVTWEANLTQSNQQTWAGTADVPSDSMAARLYGSTTIPVVVAVGEAVIKDGFILLPST